MDELLRRQDGVVSRLQLHAIGAAPHDIARLLRSRRLTPVHPGVYVDHTGCPTWVQQAWAAVLLCQRSRGPGVRPDAESSALCGESALRLHEGASSRRAGAPLRVVVATDRRPRCPPSVRLVRSTTTLARVQWHLGPPRIRYEDAVIEVASWQPAVHDVVAEIAAAVGSRRTTAARLQATVDARGRLAQRALITAVLEDVGSGACSVLEQGYLTRVERAHGLPPAKRQSRARSRTSVAYRDADYDGLVVELDGRAWHDSVEQRDRDADRDLVAAATGCATVRLTWGQVLDRPCWTAAHVARLLGVSPRRCGEGCVVSTV